MTVWGDYETELRKREALVSKSRWPRMDAPTIACALLLLPASDGRRARRAGVCSVTAKTLHSTFAQALDGLTLSRPGDRLATAIRGSILLRPISFIMSTRALNKRASCTATAALAYCKRKVDV